MNKEGFIIPKKINVGFVNRSDCYSGKLGYIVYKDNISGLLKFEKSWNGWRDLSISPEEFENVPTEGFIINHKVGGVKSGWNYRECYCRVWDPRGFEFEIEIDNFLWILDYCDCLAGKKLVGKFVYSWVGRQLVLLPTVSAEYIASSKAMKKRESLKSSTLTPGSLYKIKNQLWYYNGVSNNFKDMKAVYLGKVKVEKNLGRNYETKLLFYEPGDGTSRDFVFFVNINNIEYESVSKVLTRTEVDNLVERFELTAFSYKFWNTKDSFICKLYTQDDILDKYVESGRRKFKETSHYASIDESNKTINIYKVFVKYFRKPGSFSFFDVVRTKYLNCVVDFSGGNLKIKKDVLNLGKIWNNNDNDWLRTANNGLPGDFTVYPEATEEDFKKLSSNITSIEGIQRSRIFYETTSGYYSESLQLVLAREALVGGKSIIDSDLIIYLPIKK